MICNVHVFVMTQCGARQRPNVRRLVAVLQMDTQNISHTIYAYRLPLARGCDV
jgi:hypothetical protein